MFGEQLAKSVINILLLKNKMSSLPKLDLKRSQKKIKIFFMLFHHLSITVKNGPLKKLNEEEK